MSTPIETAPGWRAPRPIVYGTMLFAALLLLVVFALDNGLWWSLIEPLTDVPGGDKTLHFVLLGTMALLVNVCLGGRRFVWGPFVFLRGSVIVAVVATLEELSQRYLVRRAFSLDDLIYDYLGIFALGQLGGALGWALRRHSERSAARASSEPGTSR